MAEGVPTDRITTMRQQGYSNNQIIDVLQREGLKSDQIFDAINQADLKGTVQPTQPAFDQPQVENPMGQPPAPGEPPVAPAVPGEEGGDHNISEREHIEELVEVIIDEKWNELVKDINKIIEWKEKVQGDISEIKQDIETIKHDFDTLHKGVLGKIEEYDQNIVNVGTELKAMENVFSKVLPTFTENVHELTRITKHIKGVKKTK